MLERLYDLSRKKLIKREESAVDIVVREFKKVQKKLQEELASILAQITAAKKAGQPISPAFLYNQGRLQKLLKEIDTEIDRLSVSLGASITKAQKTAVLSAIAETKHLFKASKLLTTNIIGLDSEAVQNLIGRAQNGTFLSEFYKRIKKPFADRIQSTLVYGLATGRSNQEIARDVDQDLKMSRGHAMTITRTETNGSYRAASLEAYKDAGVKKYIWISAKNLNTCPMCWALHGQIFSTNKKFATHPNCRCTLVPYTGQKIETGESLFAKLTEAQQKAILGPGRFELFKTGLPLANMVGEAKTEFGDVRFLRSIKDTPTKIKKTPSAVPAKKSKPAKAAAPIVEPQPKEFFPGTIGELVEVKKLGGSTGARLVRDQEGKQWVLKAGNSPEHIREEFLADQLYTELGANVPRAKLYEEGGKVYKLAEFIDGQTLDKIPESLPEYKNAIYKLQQHFGADVLLGNRDVVGLSVDNVLVDNAGQVWRIDNGASLRFRAQGGAKVFDEYISDLWSMRNSATNQQTAKVFGKMDYYKIGAQLRDVAGAEAKILKMMPADLHGVMSKRIRNIRDIGQYADDLEKGFWKSDYADLVSKSIMDLRREKITDLLPDRLIQVKGDKTKVVDENGKSFDSLRGDNSIVSKFNDFIGKNGGAYRIIEKWQEGQAGSSWSKHPRIFKYFLSQNMVKPPSSSYWEPENMKDGFDAGKAYYEQMVKSYGGDKTYRQSMAHYKALTMEFLSKSEFVNNDRTSRALRVLRTENDAVLAKIGIRQGAYQNDVKMSRGMAESFSIFKPVSVKGKEVTVQTVRHTDVHGIYFFARRDKFKDGAFLGDGENEVVTFWDNDNVFDYIDKSDLNKHGFKN